MVFVFGKSSKNVPIFGYRFRNPGPKILILGGVHGNEPEGVVLARALISELGGHFDYKLDLTIVPEFNIDGILNKSRLNSNGVDLNRNLTTKDWNPKAFDAKYPPGPFAGSEIENQFLINWITCEKPKLILSLHSYYPLINVNGDCEPEASILHKWTGYVVTPTIGYPTPGSLGTFGIENNIPTITYEIERGSDFAKIISLHVPAIKEALKASEEKRK